MNVLLDWKDLIGVAAFIVGLVVSFGRVLLGQFEKRMREAFDAQEKLRDARLKAIEDRQEREGQLVKQLVDEMRRMAADLPMRYVQREEHIRVSTVIDAKLDRINEKADNAFGRLNEKLDTLRRGHRNGT